MKYLVEQGADINKTNKYGETALFLVCFFFFFFGNEAIIKYLVELGIDISKENNDEEISLTLAYEMNMKP